MIIEKNTYFEEKNNTINSIEKYFKRHPLDVANIARLYDDEVVGAEDTEQMVIAEIVFDHIIWKTAGGLTPGLVESVKRLTNEIIQSNPTFTHLNAEEYEDFIKMVKELNESKIDVLGDDG